MWVVGSMAIGVSMTWLGWSRLPRTMANDDAELIDIATRHLATIGPSDAELISDDEHEDPVPTRPTKSRRGLTEHVAPVRPLLRVVGWRVLPTGR